MTRLPTWETGNDGLLAVLGIEGPCCTSCEQDVNAGYSICVVYVNDGQDEVAVCCAHSEAIREALSRPVSGAEVRPR